MSTVWEWRSRMYEWLAESDWRRHPAKAALFARLRGRGLLVAAGTGLDFKHLPPGEVIGVDLSAAMLAHAKRRRRQSAATIRLTLADASRLPFADQSFDTVITSCTLCSVPDSPAVFRELHRVLGHDGRLLMFEHVASRHAVLRAGQALMNLWSRPAGTDMTRETLAVAAANGFRFTAVRSVFADVIVAAEASRADVL